VTVERRTSKASGAPNNGPSVSEGSEGSRSATAGNMALDLSLGSMPSRSNEAFHGLKKTQNSHLKIQTIFVSPHLICSFWQVGNALDSSTRKTTTKEVKVEGLAKTLACPAN